DVAATPTGGSMTSAGTDGASAAAGGPVDGGVPADDARLAEAGVGAPAEAPPASGRSCGFPVTTWPDATVSIVSIATYPGAATRSRWAPGETVSERSEFVRPSTVTTASPGIVAPR